jgi:hypothetical protein
MRPGSNMTGLPFYGLFLDKEVLYGKQKNEQSGTVVLR